MAAWRVRARCMRSSHEPYSSVPTSGGGRAGTSVAESAGAASGSPRVLSDEFIRQLLKWLPPAYGVWAVNLQELGHSDRCASTTHVRSFRQGLVRRFLRGVMSRNESVAGLVNRARQLHASLRDERREQFVQQAHDIRITGQFVRPELFDGLHAVVLHI